MNVLPVIGRNKHVEKGTSIDTNTVELVHVALCARESHNAVL